MLTIDDIMGMYPIRRTERIHAFLSTDDPTTTDSTTTSKCDEKNPCWKKSESDKPNFGISSSAYWVRFQVENKTSKSVRYLLELDYSILDYAHFYYAEGDKIKEIVLGYLISFNKRTIANRNPIFEINVKGKQNVIYFMKFSFQGSIIIPLSLWNQAAFYQNDHHDTQIFYGLYFGIFTVMILYNLFLYLLIKDTSYIYYIIYLLCMLFAILSFNGFTSEYLFPNLPKLANASVLLSIGLANGGSILFCMSFLNTKKTLPIFDKLLKIMLSICLILIIGVFLLDYKNIVEVPPLKLSSSP
jgi:hypothetical protein